MLTDTQTKSLCASFVEYFVMFVRWLSPDAHNMLQMRARSLRNRLILFLSLSQSIKLNLSLIVFVTKAVYRSDIDDTYIIWAN